MLALDVDGTSGNYHAHFTWFIEQWLGRPMPDPAQYTGGVPFHRHLGVSRATYNEAKLAYRQGGLKRWMPAYEGIDEFTHYVRSVGCQVWICTTRPYLRLDNIDPDLRHWLRRNRLQYDAVLYGQHKYRDMVKAVGNDRILMAIDDLPKMWEQAQAVGISAYLRHQPYNAYYSSANGCRLYTVDDYLTQFDKEWNARA